MHSLKIKKEMPYGVPGREGLALAHAPRGSAVAGMLLSDMLMVATTFTSASVL